MPDAATTAAASAAINSDLQDFIINPLHFSRAFHCEIKAMPNFIENGDMGWDQTTNAANAIQNYDMSRKNAKGFSLGKNFFRTDNDKLWESDSGRVNSQRR